jgi:hypothetical protein
MRIILLLLFIIGINLSAQIDTTRKEFYPLQIGNIWQYRNDINQILTATIKADTMLDGEHYYVFERVALRTQGKVVRVDSLIRVQNRRGGPTAGDSCGGNTPYELSIYHLNESDTTSWEICETFNGIPTFNQLTRFNNISTLNIFGKSREVMKFDFGGVVFGEEDTIWNYGASLVKGIGIIEEHYFDGGYRALQGAVIDGVQYGTIVSVDELIETIPKEIELYQNFPNPFNPETRIRYEINKNTNVSIKIFNILGEEITTLIDDYYQPGSYEVEFNASQLSSGVYIAVLQTEETMLTRTMLLIK